MTIFIPSPQTMSLSNMAQYVRNSDAFALTTKRVAFREADFQLFGTTNIVSNKGQAALGATESLTFGGILNQDIAYFSTLELSTGPATCFITIQAFEFEYYLHTGTNIIQFFSEDATAGGGILTASFTVDDGPLGALVNFSHKMGPAVILQKNQRG